METESYNEYDETRKRHLDDTGDGREAKRATFRSDEPLLKLLIPNYTAGALIGKGGSLMTEMKEKYGGTIRLSVNGQCYPGTADRIVVISGDIDQLIDYNTHIMERVTVDENLPADKRPKNEGRGQQVKIVLTNTAAGLLIGKGGETIKTIQQSTKARITIGSRDEACVRGERVLTMSGSMEQRLEGCRQVIKIIAEEPTNMANHKIRYIGGSDLSMNRTNLGGNNPMSGYRGGNNINNEIDPAALVTYPMSAVGGANYMNGVGNFGMNDYQTPSSSSRRLLKATVEVKLQVPDVLVGGIMGIKGQIMHELHQSSGAKIRFSNKDEFFPGTTDRILTITGNMNQCQTAHDLVNERAEQVRNQLASKR